jgi:alkanesulfonate monooxygenase SsuD/methylene tetrahydromethanopterin reductase-like flavin-dependent oxidoreductase (luciferase family)
VKGLGVALPTFVPDLSFRDMVELAVRAEELGYERFYTTESLTDTLAIDMAITLATRRILVGSFLAIIYHRHPLITYQGALTINELSGGASCWGWGWATDRGCRPWASALAAPWRTCVATCSR